MTPYTLNKDIYLADARVQVGFTLRRLRAHALTLALAGRFEALLAEWALVEQSELALDDLVDDAAVVAVNVDCELNVFAQRVSGSILALTGNDRTHVLYLHFFKGTQLHLFTRPCLGQQLKETHEWVTSLTQSPHPSLQALGAELPALLVKADAAEDAAANAEHIRRQFREVGERKLFIDDLNAARKETYGVLATLPHKHTGLSPRFADGFFRRDRSRAQGKRDIESVKASIEALQAELDEEAKLLAKLEQAEQDAKAAEAEQARLATAAKLAEIQKEIASKQQEAAALEDELQPPSQ